MINLSCVQERTVRGATVQDDTNIVVFEHMTFKSGHFSQVNIGDREISDAFSVRHTTKITKLYDLIAKIIHFFENTKK